MDKMQVVILAAGKGKRMNAEVPKVLVPFHGKPMIDYVVEAVNHSGITTKPMLVVGYGKELVMEHFGESVLYTVQSEQLGTGHAVKSTQATIPDHVTDVLVLYGDQPSITGAMVANLARTHMEKKKTLTMATVTVPSFSDWYQVFYSSFSRIIRDGAGEILQSVEFKDATEIQKTILELNPCYFCFNKKWLFEKLTKIKNENAQGEYYLTDLVKYAAQEGSITSVSISPEEALGVNTIEQLRELEGIVKKVDL